MLWDFTVNNFGNLAVFAHLPWVYPTTPIFIVRPRSSPLIVQGSDHPLFGLGTVSYSSQFFSLSAPLKFRLGDPIAAEWRAFDWR